MDQDVTLNNGVLMPLVGFGLFKVHVSEMPTAVEAAIDSGYRLFDTAQVYKNERHLSDALKSAFRKQKDIASKEGAAVMENGLRRQPTSRSDIFITSKLHPRNQSYEGAKKAVADSLIELETDYIDLYLIHWPGTSKLKPENPANAENRRTSWEALETVYREEKCLRAIGVSNFTPTHLRQLLEESSVRPAVLQSEFHPRLFQDDLLHFCKENKIQFQAYSSLGTSSPTNQLLFDPFINQLARKYEKSNAQILLKFGLQHDALIIPKSTKPAHILENTRLFDFELSPEDMETLEQMNEGVHYCWNPDAIT